MRVRKALATLPWVEQSSIKADVATKEVRFGLRDKAAFNMEAIQDALEQQNFPDVELLDGPT